MRRLLLISIALSCCGCSLFRNGEPEYYRPVVVGERIRIVRPGETVVVPPLQRPAETWFLVDDVGLSFWLGIPYNHIPNGQTAYDSAISGLDEAESVKEEMRRRLDGCRRDSRE